MKKYHYFFMLGYPYTINSVFLQFIQFIFFLGGFFLISGCAVQKPSPCWKNGRLYGTTNDWVVSHDWDSCYRRGLSYGEGTCWEPAGSQFRQAIKQRPKDQWRARTYGMNVLEEYFPHRELGIVYFRLGRFEEAIEEFLVSLSSAESAKTKYFLNKARSRWLEKTGLDRASPMIQLSKGFEEEGKLIYSKDSCYTVTGQAIDDFFISSILINGKPLLFDLAQPKISFQEEITLTSGINAINCQAIDLVGHQDQKEINIFLDQQGPTVIFNPLYREGLSNDRVSILEIKGLIFDSGGLDNLVIGDKEIPVNRGEKAQEFCLEIHNDLPPDNKIFKAKDLAGNCTTGDLSWLRQAEENEKPLTGRSQEIKVCDKDFLFLPSTAFEKVSQGSGKSFKIIIQDCPKVVIEPVVVIQGRVESACGIRGIWLNEEPVFSGEETGGLLDSWQKFFYGERTVYYFTRLLEGLKEGENQITISAEDREGRSIRKKIIIKYQVREIERIGNRWCLAILPFKKHEMDQPLFAERKPGNLASLDASLQYSFFQSGRFNLIERDRIDAVMQELEFRFSLNLDKGTCSKLGSLLSAEVLLAGSIQEGWDGQDHILKIIARLVEVQTGRLLAIKDAYNTWKTYQDEEYLLEGLTQKFLLEFPLLQGKVIDKNHTSLELTLGTYDSIKQGMKVLIYRQRKTDREQDILGEARVEEVTNDSSRVLPSEKDLLHTVQIGDLVITK